MGETFWRCTVQLPAELLAEKEGASVVARSMRSPPGRCVCGCAVDALSTPQVCLWLRGRCALHPAKVCLWLRGRCALHPEGVSVVARSMRSPPRPSVCLWLRGRCALHPALPPEVVQLIFYSPS